MNDHRKLIHMLTRTDIERTSKEKRTRRAHRLFVRNFLPRLFYIIPHCRRALSGIWSLYSTYSLSYDMGFIYLKAGTGKACAGHMRVSGRSQ